MDFRGLQRNVSRGLSGVSENFSDVTGSVRGFQWISEAIQVSGTFQGVCTRKHQDSSEVGSRGLRVFQKGSRGY